LGTIELVDERGNAEPASLTPMPDGMFCFRVGDDGQESTHDCITETCYSELNPAFATAERDETGLGHSANGMIKFGKQLSLERTRLRVPTTTQSRTHPSKRTSGPTCPDQEFTTDLMHAAGFP